MELSDFEGRYGFELDDFQREAIGHLSRGRSVLVTAPTGSGKTVIAEYALEKTLEEGEKCFYTAPLKALSNQKYRDFCQTAGSEGVGLLTGDNSINGDAPLVVMTTEVLRNMIYEDSALLENLGVVVLDEVHYMHDPFRGRVWEEIVIRLPRRVKLVALSATVSNVTELGSWMESLRGDVEIVASRQRPVKLENYYSVGRAMVPLFSRKIQKVVDEQLEAIKRSRARKGGGRKGSLSRFLRPRRVEVIRELLKRDMLPAIYFIFSRSACDDSAFMWLSEGKMLTTSDEKRRIAGYLDEKADCLDAADLECLGYYDLRESMMAGVAVHHAGVLPLFKEAVEELFAAGLIKVVFATETLSLGINMPARTVVMESLSKWAGDRHRPITPGEYKQLTGRAGRRGIDDVGYAVVLYQKQFSHDRIKSLVKSEPDPVESSFGVSYNMAVNILADHDFEEARHLINLSFAQYVADRRVVRLESRMDELEESIGRFHERSSCERGDAAEYRQLEKKVSTLNRQLASTSDRQERARLEEVVKSLKPGDVISLGPSGSEKVYAVVRRHRGKREGDLLAMESSGRYRKLSAATMREVPSVVGSVEVEKISSPSKKVRKSLASSLETLKNRAPQEGKARDTHLEEMSSSLESSKLRLESLPCHRCEKREGCLKAARSLERSRKKMENVRKEVRSSTNVVSRKLGDVAAVLGELGFIRGEGITAKGEILRRVYNESDLLLVEAIHQGLLDSLPPEYLAVAASWFVHESRDGEKEVTSCSARPQDEGLPGKLEATLQRLQGVLARIKEVEKDRGLDLLGSMDIGFSNEALRWASGAPLEEMLESFVGWSVGDMVRNMKQIIDLLRQVSQVSGPQLRIQSLRAMNLIDRGVVGYSSLESIIEHRSQDANEKRQGPRDE